MRILGIIYPIFILSLEEPAVNGMVVGGYISGCPSTSEFHPFWRLFLYFILYVVS